MCAWARVFGWVWLCAQVCEGACHCGGTQGCPNPFPLLQLQREVCAGHEMDMPSRYASLPCVLLGCWLALETKTLICRHDCSRCRLLVSLARRILHHGPAQWAAALVPWISQVRTPFFFPFA